MTLPYRVEDLAQTPAGVSTHLLPDGQPFVIVDSGQNIVGFNLPGAISDKLQRLAEKAQRRLFKKRPSIFVEGLEKVYHDTLDAIFMPEPRKFGRGIPKISPCWLNHLFQVGPFLYGLDGALKFHRFHSRFLLVHPTNIQCCVSSALHPPCYLCCQQSQEYLTVTPSLLALKFSTKLPMVQCTRKPGCSTLHNIGHVHSTCSIC